MKMTPIEKACVLVSVNASIILLFAGLFLIPFSEPEEAFHFIFFLAHLGWVACIPLVGRTGTAARNVPRFIFTVLAVKMACILVLELVDAAWFPEKRWFFPGYYDFRFQYEYTLNTLRGDTTWAFIPGGGIVDVYYPPGVLVAYIFLTFLNPMQSTLLYRWLMLLFEAGTVYLVWKIASIPRFAVQPEHRDAGVVYAFFAISVLSVLNVFGKYDTLLMFVCIAGSYCYFKGRYMESGALLAFAGFMKLYPFTWLLGMFILHARRRTFKDLLRLAGGAAIVGGAILGLSLGVEGTRLLDLIFRLDFQIGEGAYAIYMMNVWFFIAYTGLPFSNLIPYALLACSLLYFFCKVNQDITPAFFLKTTAIVLFFYTAVNIAYFHFLIYFICIDMLGSVKKVRVMATLEIAAWLVELVFNLILAVNGLLNTFILRLDVLPPAWYVAFRLANLALFLTILVMIVFPRWFDRWLPAGPVVVRMEVTSQ